MLGLSIAGVILWLFTIVQVATCSLNRFNIELASVHSDIYSIIVHVKLNTHLCVVKRWNIAFQTTWKTNSSRRNKKKHPILNESFFFISCLSRVVDSGRPAKLHTRQIKHVSSDIRFANLTRPSVVFDATSFFSRIKGVAIALRKVRQL